MAKVFRSLFAFYEAISPESHNYDRVMWLRDTDDYKEVRCMWLYDGEYDGGEIFIYQKHLTDNQMNKDRKWRITLTEEQMCVMMAALEDWHRFVSGQCSMGYATSYIDSPMNMHLARTILNEQVKPLMFPELTRGESYSWNGGQPNPHLSQAAAISYLLYREARHQLTLASNPKVWNCYESETLTCAEQGKMIKVELLKDEK